ncbi:hypothetical protein GOARA_086_00010, partial [Gordonia araii NBRC 100433]
FPDLVEHASQVHPDLKSLVENLSEPGCARLAEATSLCEMWVDPEFMKLLSTLKLDGRLPAIAANIDARCDSKRVLVYTAPEGTETADVRKIVQRAWTASINTFAEALHQRAKEIAVGKLSSGWTPDQAVNTP